MIDGVTVLAESQPRHATTAANVLLMVRITRQAEAYKWKLVALDQKD